MQIWEPAPAPIMKQKHQVANVRWLNQNNQPKTRSKSNRQRKFLHSLSKSIYCAYALSLLTYCILGDSIFVYEFVTLFLYLHHCKLTQSCIMENNRSAKVYKIAQSCLINVQWCESKQRVRHNRSGLLTSTIHIFLLNRHTKLNIFSDDAIHTHKSW